MQSDGCRVHSGLVACGNRDKSTASGTLNRTLRIRQLRRQLYPGGKQHSKQRPESCSRCKPTRRRRCGCSKHPAHDSYAACGVPLPGGTLTAWPVVSMRQNAAHHSTATSQDTRCQPLGRRCQRQQSKRASAKAPPALLLLLMLLASLLGCDARAAKPVQAEERLIGEHASRPKLALHMPCKLAVYSIIESQKTKDHPGARQSH
jgi:hypothetical protein